MTGPIDLSFVIPVYNEAESLRELHTQITSNVKQLGKRYEIIFVNDGSSDSSWATIQALHDLDEHVRGIGFRRNFGKASALSAGFAQAKGTIVFTLDADLQDDPIEIPNFLAKLDEGYDVVSGWKKIRHDPWHKVLPSRVFNAMVSRKTGVTLHDHNCGFKAYRREVVKHVTLYGERHRFVPVLAAAAGFKVGEVIIHHRARPYGKSKYGWNRFLRGFLDLQAVSFESKYGHRPFHWFGTQALILLFFGLLLVITSPVLAFFNPGSPAWLAPMIGGGTLIVGGLSSYLVGLALEATLARNPPAQPFSVSETIPRE